MVTQSSKQPQAALSVRDLKVVLSNHTILDNLSFDVQKNQVTMLFGKNGVGKTTLQRTLCGLIRPTQGEYTIGGVDSRTMSRKDFSRSISYIPQSYYPPFQYNVIDFVVMGRAPHGGVLFRPGKAEIELAAEMLDRVGKIHLAYRSYNELSTGERQLVLIARGLAQDTPVLLLDEPIANLDLTNQYKVMDIVRDLARTQEKTVVVTLHDPHLSLEYADHFLVLLDHDKHTQFSHSDETYFAEAKEALQQVYDRELDIEVISGRHFVVMH